MSKRREKPVVGFFDFTDCIGLCPRGVLRADVSSATPHYENGFWGVLPRFRLAELSSLTARCFRLCDRSLKLESTPPLRYLGLDIGSKRIGVAVSDGLGLTAQPVLTLEVRHNPREDLRSLARLARRFGVAAIVVGNPLHMSGEQSPRAAKTQAFAAELGSLTGLPIHMWDERLTTHEAHQILYQAGHARQQHRRIVDQVAATLILQSFIDEKSREQGAGKRE